MDSVKIIVIIAALAIGAVRLYQKYNKKNKEKSGIETKASSGSTFPTSSFDDDYEPYSKK